jgi:amylosucrase
MSLTPSSIRSTASQATLLQQRFVRFSPALRQKLAQVYGQCENFDAWLTHLIEEISELAQQRSADLLELDTERLQHPDWFLQQDMLGYCTYVDRFAGDLQGVKKQIPHLVKLGVRYLHLLPFFQARRGENDGGFAVSSFDKIQEGLGTIDDLRELTSALRQKKISLCADFVLNHVADDHPWALAAKGGDPCYQAYFHTFADRDLPDQYEQTVGQIFPQAAPGNFSFNPELQKWVWTTFYPYQWDLNYSNPEVFAQIALAMLRMANLGIEAFRLDSTAFLWKRLGTNCMNQPEAHLLLQALRDIIEIAAPGVLLKAEAIVATADLPAYLGNETQGIKECHIAYHSSLMASSWVALAEQKVDLIEAVIAATPNLPAQASWLNYVRCHDDIGWNVLRAEAAGTFGDTELAKKRLKHAAHFFSDESSSYADGLRFQASDPDAVHGTVGMAASLCGITHALEAQDPFAAQLAIRRLLLMYGLSLSFGGIPLIYMGDELAQTNDRSFLADPTRNMDGRWLQRPHFDQDAQVNLHDMSRRSSKVFAQLCELIRQRQHLPALAATAARQLLTTPCAQVLGFVRGDVHNHAHLIYLSNFSELPQSLLSAEVFAQIPFAASNEVHYVDVLSGEIMGTKINLAAYSQRWLRLISG